MRSTLKNLLFIAILCLIATGSGCSVRGVVTSAPQRLFREVHALRVRSYQITPVTDDLRQYKAIEIHRLDNLMLDEIPAQSVEQLNSRIVEEIKSLNHFDSITEVEGTSDAPGRQTNQPGNVIAPTLVIEGYIDDYTPGIPSLRYIEQGNNHAILTVRITLKDKQTGSVLGQKNITVENSRVTSNIKRMVNRSAEEVAGYVRQSTTH